MGKQNKDFIQFVADVNNLYNSIGNDIRTAENMLLDGKSTKEEIHKFMVESHEKHFKIGSDLGLSFDEANGVPQIECKSC